MLSVTELLIALLLFSDYFEVFGSVSCQGVVDHM